MLETFVVRARCALRCTAAAAGVAAAVAGATAPSAHAVPVGGLPEAISGFALTPNRVAGANDWSCKPSAEHPRPVVLVHGTFLNLGANWTLVSPTLKNAGYCVFALNYGSTGLSVGGRINGLGDIGRSAGELSAFVDRVLAATGAAEVDIVGHSQGGMMPNHYVKFLGGADKVHKLIGLAPSNHGTDLWGLIRLARSLSFIGQPILNVANQVLTDGGARGVQQQLKGDQFQRRLWAGGDTVPGVSYTVISTRYDWVVTPWKTQYLNGPDTDNILVQALCPRDRMSHAGIILDGPTMQIVLNELGADDPAFRPDCRSYGPGI
ncbi:MAG: alpha/beta fold hydrolase [Solirubrobacteraceae bacterium]|nr:alpha/beta fold hydrolase [Solirubrobacteraceae bacterium]